jgi:8-oxo-dGTP pyrophosphatase MutT (NUDIX family)
VSRIERVRASVVCVRDSHLLCVELRDPTTRVARLFVPGGALEPGETAAQAAEREAWEETGYRVRVDESRAQVARYPYTWGGQTRDVTTHFFRAALVAPAREPAQVRDVDYNEGVRWLALAAVPEALGFQQDILAAVSRLLAPR